MGGDAVGVRSVATDTSSLVDNQGAVVSGAGVSAIDEMAGPRDCVSVENKNNELAGPTDYVAVEKKMAGPRDCVAVENKNKQAGPKDCVAITN